LAACNFSQITVTSGGRVQAAGDYTIVGNSQGHANAAGGYVRIPGVTVTLSGTPVFSGSFLSASRNGTLDFFNNTVSGSATGQRFSVTGNAVIFTNGLSTTALPGTSSPTSPYPSGGQYL